jgi:hypothetical protein
VDVWIGRQEAVPHRCDHRRRRHDAGVDTQAAERPLPILVEVIQRAGDLGDRRPQPLEQAPPRVGQRDAARRAMQQADAEALLQLSHGVAERRGRDADPRGRRPEAEFVSDGDECRQIGEVTAVQFMRPSQHRMHIGGISIGAVCHSLRHHAHPSKLIGHGPTSRLQRASVAAMIGASLFSTLRAYRSPRFLLVPNCVF